MAGTAATLREGEELKHLTHIAVIALATGAVSLANASGAAYSDRFGYTGTLVRYNSLADAQAGVNSVGTVNVGNRDLAIYVDDNDNVVMGSWWYTTSNNGAGWGNVHGNTGLGFLQLYETNTLTRTSFSTAFSGWNGTHWTTFNLSLSGQNATYASSFARFSTGPSNVNDRAIFHTYNLNFTAGGLNGTESGGLITSTIDPTSVNGSFSGLMQVVGGGAEDGYYTFDLALDLDNWAYANRANLIGIQYEPSVFVAPVPEPFTMALGGAAAAAFIRKRRRAKAA